MDMLSWNKTPHRLFFMYIPSQFTTDDINQLSVGIFVSDSQMFPCDIHGDVCTSVYVFRHLNIYSRVDPADICHGRSSRYMP